MLDERVQEVERELLDLKERIERVEAQRGTTAPAPAPARKQAPTQTLPPPRLRPPAAPTPERPTPLPVTPKRPAMELPDLEDLLGGRVLAWLGGTAVLVGLAFLLALGISSGWIGEGARTLMGGVTAAGLIAVGVWLHERRGRTDAALAALSAGIAAMFAVAAVGSQLYGVIPAVGALTLALATGSLAMWLAVRWRSQGIAALGLLGAMVAPAVAEAPFGPASTAVLFIACCAAVAVLVSQGWRWLSFGAIALALPQGVAFAFEHTEEPVQLIAVLAAFGLLGAVAAVGHEVRERPDRLAASSSFLLVLNAFVVGCAGWFALLDGPGRTTALCFMWGLAVAHGALGLAAGRRGELPRDLSLLLLTVTALLANVAFAVTVDGTARSLGWAATAVGFAALLRGRRAETTEGKLVTAGLGGHLALAMVQVLTSDVSVSLVGAGGTVPLASAAALVGLAAACFASGRLAEEHAELRMLLDVIGLLAVAYLTAISVDGLALVLAFAVEAVALSGIARKTGDRVAIWAAPTVLSLAGALALGLAPPNALGVGLTHPLEAAGALGSVIVACLVVACAARPAGARPWLVGAAALTGLYLASVLVVTPFQPDGAAAQSAVLELPVRQQGQVLLSALWAICGVAGIVVGLVRDQRPARLTALGLLGVAVAKVFLFDLATLTSVYRVISFMGLGLLLLMAAFAWQRVRPRALADMREVPDAIR